MRDTSSHPPPESHDVVIIGSGSDGMPAATVLEERGRDEFVVLDREDDLGGTSHVNSYPGVAADVASVTNSCSAAPNPHWLRLVSPGVAIKRYGDHHDLRRHLRSGRAVDNLHDARPQVESPASATTSMHQTGPTRPRPTARSQT